MNILLINHYAGSPDYGMEFRPYYLAKEWVKNGHNVTIVASSFSHLRKRQPYVSKPITKDGIDGINYIWLKTNHYNGNGILRVINIFSFVFKLLIHNKNVFDNLKPNVVIASSTYPLDIIPAIKISKKYNARLIFEIHDLWPLSPIELGGMSPWHPFILIMKFAEKLAYKKSDIVVSILPNTLEYIRSIFIEPKKFYYIPNGIEISEWNIKDNIRENSVFSELESLQKQGYFLIGYAGGHAISNALDLLVESGHFIKTNNVLLVLIGSGIEKERLISKARQLNIKNIKFFDPISKSLIPKALSYFDILYIGWQKKRIYKYGVCPNKIVDYMMAGKPIIHGIDSPNNIINTAHCGITIEPENPKAIAKAIDEIAKLPIHDRLALGENGKKYAITYHNYSVLSEKFISAMED